jgi:DNA-binding LacI/PurR family transcriptional regulator
MGVTLRDVALAAGVSKTTVSRVLNNSRSVSGPTRAKVSAAFAHLGYSPHVHAAALRRKHVKAAHPINSIEERALFGYFGQVEQLLALREENLALKRIIGSFRRDTRKYLENEG